MWAVSDRFLKAIGAPHRILTTITVTPFGSSTPVPVVVKEARVSVDSRNRIRRRLELTLVGGRSTYDLCASPGSRYDASSGIDFLGGTTETPPVFQGRSAMVRQDLNDGTVQVTAVDWGDWVGQSRFLAPFAVTSDTPRPTVIGNAVTGARPGTMVSNQSTDVGVVTSARVWSRNRNDLINDLTNDGNTEAFFRPDGVFLIRDQASLATAAPVYDIASGQGGTLKSARRERPLDKLYNTVVVAPAGTDGTQTWAPQIAQITDPNHPWHPNRIGVVPYFYSSPTILDSGTAYGAAQTILARVQGNAETLSIGAIANPALEAGDVVRVTVGKIGQDQAAVWRHYLDSFTINLLTHDMTAQTRAVRIENDQGSQ